MKVAVRRCVLPVLVLGIAVLANLPRGPSSYLSFIQHAGFPLTFARNSGEGWIFIGVQPVLIDVLFWLVLVVVACVAGTRLYRKNDREVSVDSSSRDSRS